MMAFCFKLGSKQETVMSDTLTRIDEMVKKYPVVLFMKGSPQFPMCGFSSKTVEILKSINSPFAWCNVIADSDVRAELPKYQNWPTFPQLYIQGELVGGCDIVSQMHEAGELAGMIEAQTVAFEGLE